MTSVHRHKKQRQFLEKHIFPGASIRHSLNEVKPEHDAENWNYTRKSLHHCVFISRPRCGEKGSTLREPRLFANCPGHGHRTF